MPAHNLISSIKKFLYSLSENQNISYIYAIGNMTLTCQGSARKSRYNFL